MKRIVRASLALCVAAAVTIQSAPSRASGVPVVDVAAILQAAQQVAATVAQLKIMEKQLERLKRDVRSLDPRSFGGIITLLEKHRRNSTMAIFEFTKLGEALGQVDASFGKLFPSAANLQGTTGAEQAGVSQAMNQEVNAAAKQAIIAQSSLRALEDSADASRGLLEQSAGNDSQVAQLQLAVQMIALISQNIRGIVRVMATAGRVTSVSVAQEVTERRLAVHQHQQAMEGYTGEQGGAGNPMRGYLRSGNIPAVRGSLGESR